MARLGDVAHIIMGQSPKGETYNKSGLGVPLLNGPTEFGPSHPLPSIWTDAPTRLCDVGDLLFCVRGSTTGRMNWADQVYCLGRGVGAFRGKSAGADTRFIYFSLQHRLLDLLGLSAGSVFPNLSKRDFEAFSLPWPDRETRLRIASILGTLDDKIELNRKMNETLEGMARALFKSWFVDFDPVKAKAEGRRPAGMDAETAALFPDLFENSELGEIPRGWSVKPLPTIIYINPLRKLSKGEIAPYLDMKNMPTQGHRPLGWTDRLFGSGSKFANGHTLLARITPCLENGKTAFVDFLQDDRTGWGSTEYIVLRPKPPLPVEYAYYLARSEELRKFAIGNMTGSSGRQRVPVSCFNQYRLVAPPAAVAEAFGRTAGKLIQLIRANTEQSETLARIRDALLPKLMSGQLPANVLAAHL